MKEPYVKVMNPKDMGNYKGYGRGGPMTKKTYPKMKGGNAKKGKYAGANVQASRYCDY
ncbi:MAG: hypothetical protein GTN99_07075 [Candidatus Dadabacteria bacterium]|nr:hypothetical protein [Candidatus Dadabacteria bacterium]